MMRVFDIFYIRLACALLIIGPGCQCVRDDAFIGYQEKKPDACIDTNASCEKWSKGVLSQCIENAYYMRQYCRKACAVSPFCTKNDHLPPWEGYATPEGTRLYSTMFPGAYAAAEHHFRRDPNMGSYFVPGQDMRGAPWLHLSSLGIGTYLGDEDDDTDALVSTAVVASVNRGWNVIDTASNYRGGRAERAVGHALLALRTASVGITRGMLFVSTKAGFVSTDMAEALLSAGRKQGGVSKEDVVGGNCIHPNCLAASLKRSLKHLKLDTVDILYLHNAAESAQALGQPVLMRRLADAFGWLESARTAGRIQAYGMATWDCFRKAPDKGGLQLQRIVKLAQGVAGPDHGFRYVQLPINAAMREAWEEKWQSVELDGETKQLSFMEAAARLGIGVFASGPLLEGSLLKDAVLQKKLEAAEELDGIAGHGPRLLQISRSTPYVTAALIGHKQATHADLNIRLTAMDPLDRAGFKDLMKHLLAAR